MSTINVNAIDKESGSTLTLGGAGTTLNVSNMVSDVSLSNRNLVINGDMQIAQRATSVTGITGAGYNTLDRWYTSGDAGTWTQTQDSTTVGTSGFAYSLKNDCTTADASLAVSDRRMMSYRFEGLNLQHLKKGTASAESLTVSFWVNATKTGTYILELYDHDNSRHICSPYTVSVSNTWEYKTITFAGDTTGALDKDDVKSLELQWYMAAGTNYTSGTLATSWASAVSANRAVGQVNSADSTSNNFSLTGVQMEVGSVATPFEHRTYGDELEACQRYYYEPFSSRAWVNFNGSGTVAIRASGNVSSITDNATGDYTINFTTSMPDVNYAVVGSTGTNPITFGSTGAPVLATETFATGSIRIATGYSYGTAGYFGAVDWDQSCIGIIR